MVESQLSIAAIMSKRDSGKRKSVDKEEIQPLTDTPTKIQLRNFLPD